MKTRSERSKLMQIYADNAATTKMSQTAIAAMLPYMQGSGTAGEYLTMGSVVNTFLTAFDAETMTLTVNGKPLETGHDIYDYDLGFYE